jgi:predicted alpha-1,2-mannosidase
MAALGATLAIICYVAPAPPARAGADPVMLVNPFIGTSGTVDDFPGADAPFGMIQWSPDTPSRPPGGGYEYDDPATTGFSLTHLSGPGCVAFGDFPILPMVGAVSDPANAKQAFSHEDETASPGYYTATIGAPPIRVELTATTRAGIGRFTFPQTSQADLIVDVSGSQAGDSDARFDVVGPQEISGSATSGHFCDSPDEFTVYFAARFDKPIASYGTWTQSGVEPGAHTGSGPGSGGWVTFDASTDPVVTMDVGVSFVSVAEAAANLQAEVAASTFDAVRARTARAWRDALGAVEIDGGTASEQHIFYTALYHSMLHPNVFSDEDGSYEGFDGKVHHVRPGHAEYANYSGWDVYRTLIPLIALLQPQRASDMMQSLVDAGAQGGWLPKWPLANTYTDAMNGDSADPIIASAFAFGAHDFDAAAALREMVKGATDTADAPGQGWYVARPNLQEYEQRGYVSNTHTNSVSPLPNAASETLEYSIDDFAISRLAQELGDESDGKTFAARAKNWANLFDSADGLIQPRDDDGAFFETPMNTHGQSGFQEGNSVQYTWLVPQDLRGLFDAMGGNAVAAQRLDDFFTQLDSGPGDPHAWLGNEPSILQPWLYLSALQPWKTQALLRRIESTLYSEAPAGLAGNDDLGTMSAWYVWAAIGLYPQTPGVPMLDIGSPLFPHIVVHSSDGRTIQIVAPAASDADPYVESLRVDGAPSSRTWLIVPQSGETILDFDLGATPNMSWGSGPGDGPPSWTFSAVHVPPATAATLAVSPQKFELQPGGGATIVVELSDVRGDVPVTATWSAQLPGELTSSTMSGTLTAAAAGSSTARFAVVAGPAVPAGFYNVMVAGTASNGAVLHRATATVQVVRPGVSPDFAYVLDFSEASITPIDLRSLTFGPAIAVGDDPGDAAMSLDGSMLFVANQGSASVSVVDTASLSTVATIPVGQVPAGIRTAPDGRTVWVSDYGDNDVRPIDVETRKAGAPIAVGIKPEELAIAPDGSTLYVVDQGSDAVTPVDLRTRTVRAPIPVGRVPIGIVISSDGRMAYVTNMGSNDVTPIDLVAGAALAPIRVGAAPQQPAISPDGRTMYVPDSGSGDVTPIDLATRVAGAPIRVGNGPFSVMFSADGKSAFVVVSGDDVCVPIDVATRRAGTPIPTGAFPIAIVR